MYLKHNYKASMIFFQFQWSVMCIFFHAFRELSGMNPTDYPR